MLQGKIGRISTYSPLDFFSGDAARLHAALLALLEQPQNNARLHMNGLPVPVQHAPAVLQQWAGCSDAGQAREHLATQLASVLSATGKR